MVAFGYKQVAATRLISISEILYATDVSPLRGLDIQSKTVAIEISALRGLELSDNMIFSAVGAFCL